MKILVAGSLKNVPSQPELCAAFVASLGRQIVQHGHVLLNGCRGSLDKAIAEAAEAHLRALGRKPEAQLIGYRLKDAQPIHRLGIVRISDRADWELSHPQLVPPEQIAEAQAVIFVAGAQGTYIAANWARIAGIPVLGVAVFGGAGSELYSCEKARLGARFGHSITADEFAVLNWDTTDMERLAAEVLALAERIVVPRTVFPVLPFAASWAGLKDSFRISCHEAGFELRGTEEEATTERIIPRILEGIRRAALVIADVTEERPNLYYEIGYAQGLGKDVVLTARRGTQLPFDMADLPVIFWDDHQALREQLVRRLLAIAPPARAACA